MFTMKWTEEFRVSSQDCDLNGMTGAGAILRYMQETANLQMSGQGPSYDSLVEQGYSFILSRIGMSIYAPLVAEDRIRCESWAVASRGVTYNRCYRILRGDDLIAEASSAWALLGIEDKKLRRVGEVPLNYSEDEPLELDLPIRFRIPAEAEMKLVGERTIYYSDVDRNGHMNNTRYLDMFCSFLPDMRNQRVISVLLNFASEAPLGETEKIYCGEYDGAYYVRSVRPSGAINAEAEILLETIR